MIKNNMSLFILIVMCGLVTWVPRILPFIFTKKVTFSDFWKRFLTYIPTCILTALFVQSLFVVNEGKLTTIDFETLFVSIPTIAIAFLTKSLIWTVIFGIVLMSLIRYFGIF